MPDHLARLRLIGGKSGERDGAPRSGRAEEVSGGLTLRRPVDDRFRQPAPRGLNRAHLRQQFTSGGPVTRMLGQAAPDQRPDLIRQQTEVSRGVDQPVD